MELFSLEKLQSKISVDLVIKCRLIETSFISKFQGKKAYIHPKTIAILSARKDLFIYLIYRLKKPWKWNIFHPICSSSTLFAVLNLNGTSDAAARNPRVPFLLKCCRVEYNKETNRLEITCKGERICRESGHDSERHGCPMQ